MSIEAMKQAFEALELSQNMILGMEQNYGNLWIVDETPESLDCLEKKISSIINTLGNAIADAEQAQPVALETVYETIIHWDEGGGKRSRRELARRIVDLYTAPPQRTPLTDEQIFEAWRSVSAVAWTEVLEFAREIERLVLEGIGGEE